MQGGSRLRFLRLGHNCGPCDLGSDLWESQLPRRSPELQQRNVPQGQIIMSVCVSLTLVTVAGNSCGQCDRLYHTCSTLEPLLQQKDIRGRYVPQPETTTLARLFFLRQCQLPPYSRPGPPVDHRQKNRQMACLCHLDLRVVHGWALRLWTSLPGTWRERGHGGDISCEEILVAP